MMNIVKAIPVNREAFAPYGVYYDMLRPDGYALEGEIHKFYPDRISESASTRIGYSPITVRKEEHMTVKAVEYHTTTPEMILPLNDDMIIHVAPASGGTPVTGLTEAFVIPRGTLVKINTAVWHLAPLPVHEEELHAMIILPECTYANDCTVVELKEEEWFEIVL
ncbi:ureidoglycolate lyase [Lachnospiraceae bacterium 50-23]|jgi:ureidoglycolate lyase